MDVLRGLVDDPFALQIDIYMIDMYFPPIAAMNYSYRINQLNICATNQVKCDLLLMLLRIV